MGEDKKFNLIWYLVMLIIFLYLWPVLTLGLIIFGLFIMFAVIVALRISDGVKFRDMPSLFGNVLSHPIERIIFPIIRAIIFSAFYVGLGLFFAIFSPLFIEVMEFMRNGVWTTLTLNDLVYRLKLSPYGITPYDIPGWRGVEKLLNWFCFEASATLAILIIFGIYLTCMTIIFKNIDDKTAKKIFENKDDKNEK